MINTKETIHPSLKNYILDEPIPEGYKLDMVTYPTVEKFAIEWLSKIEEDKVEIDKAA